MYFFKPNDGIFLFLCLSGMSKTYAESKQAILSHDLDSVTSQPFSVLICEQTAHGRGPGMFENH